ncbi:hypothetical protein B0H14DRAFT_3125503 [Mycena olivaceomarginata]|nr:hypothetical protein B0H14DRAFT_3125503 [Mycena olivaceomarginata]
MFDWIQNDVPTPSTSIDSVGTPISEQATSRIEERFVVELAESGRRAKQGEVDGPEVEGGGLYYCLLTPYGGPIRRMAVDASHPSAVVRWMAVLIRRPPAASTGLKKFPLPVPFTTSIQQQPVDVGRFHQCHGQIRWTMAEFTTNPPASAGVSAIIHPKW